MRSGSVTLRSPHQQRCCCHDSCSVSVAIIFVTIPSCLNFTQELLAVVTMALFWHQCSLRNIEHRLLNQEAVLLGGKVSRTAAFVSFTERLWDGVSRPARVCSRLTADCVCFLSTGMAAAVRLPAFCRPQNVSAALRSSHAVCYRCHAAPLRSQCHGDAGQQHHRVSHVHLVRPRGSTVTNA